MVVIDQLGFQTKSRAQTLKLLERLVLCLATKIPMGLQLIRRNCLHLVCLEEGDSQHELFNRCCSPRGLKRPDLRLRQTRHSLQCAPASVFMTSFGKCLTITGPAFKAQSRKHLRCKRAKPNKWI